MSKIIAPNNQYTGISASVSFVNGIGETDNPELIKWFERSGYSVEKTEDDKADQDPGELTGMDIDQLREYAEEHGIDIGAATSVNGILKKIKEAEKKEA